MKRNTSMDLRAAQNLRDRMIRTAFVQVPGALRSRPSGARVTFDNAARGTCPSSPWRIDQDAIRAVARAAAEGSAIEVSETRARIKAYFAAREADALSELPAESDLCVVQAVIRQSEIQGPADVAENELLARPTCRERLLAFARHARAHICALTTAANAAERTARTLPSTGVRLWR